MDFLWIMGYIDVTIAWLTYDLHFKTYPEHIEEEVLKQITLY